MRKIALALDEGRLRQMVPNYTQVVIELAAEDHIGAGLHERSPNRLTLPSGYCEHRLKTRMIHGCSFRPAA